MIVHVHVYIHTCTLYALQSDHSPMVVSVRDIGGLSLFFSLAAVEEREGENIVSNILMQQFSN